MLGTSGDTISTLAGAAGRAVCTVSARRERDSICSMLSCMCWLCGQRGLRTCLSEKGCVRWKHVVSESTLANSAVIATLITAAQTHSAVHRFPTAAANTFV